MHGRAEAQATFAKRSLAVEKAMQMKIQKVRSYILAAGNFCQRTILLWVDPLILSK